MSALSRKIAKISYHYQNTFGSRNNSDVIEFDDDGQPIKREEYKVDSPFRGFAFIELGLYPAKCGVVYKNVTTKPKWYTDDEDLIKKIKREVTAKTREPFSVLKTDNIYTIEVCEQPTVD